VTAFVLLSELLDVVTVLYFISFEKAARPPSRARSSLVNLFPSF